MSAAAAARPAAYPAAGPRPVALLLPGQGSQHPGMAAGLYAAEPAFADAVDEVLDAMGGEGGRIRDDWLTGTGTAPGGRRALGHGLPMDHVLRSQPLLFALDFAFGRLVESWGIRPATLLGHSIGELAAASLAEVFTVRDAARVVLDRVVRLAQAPPGGLLAVAAAPDRLEPYLGDGVVVGAVNAPQQTVLAGPENALRAVGQRLCADGLAARRVPALSPFHSPVIAPYAQGAERLLASVARREPKVPVYSCYTAAPLTAAQCANPAFWAAQPVDRVRFWPALDALLTSGDHVVVEAGPGRGLSSVARRHPAVRCGRSRVIALAPKGQGVPEDERVCLKAAREELRDEGYPVPL